jgi:uncharacterized protein YeaO (DUF488 family)
MTSLAIKRIYEPASPGDGTRILVDRLWPRGVAKAKAHIDLWLKDIAPSDGLRKRFHGKSEDWDEFCAAYARELESAGASEALAELSARLKQGPVTLLYAARDEEHNNAAALRDWLGRKVRHTKPA